MDDRSWTMDDENALFGAQAQVTIAFRTTRARAEHPSAPARFL